MRVLVADDDEISRDLIEHTLRRAGYDVETADNGRQALEIVRSGRCRLVISDWSMPQMSGIELCRAIRCDVTSEGYVYLILLTSHSSPDEIVAGMSAGADDFIEWFFRADRGEGRGQHPDHRRLPASRHRRLLDRDDPLGLASHGAEPATLDQADR